MDKIQCGICKNGSMELVNSKIAARVYRCVSCGDTKIWGPCCGQGWVRPLRIRKLDEIVFACRECEAMWKQVDDIGSIDPRTSLSRYMDEHGMRSMPDEVEEMGLTGDLEPIILPSADQKQMD